MTASFHRDRLTWTAYVMLAWFAYLQAAPGQVVAHLRDELDLSYSVGGLHVAAFAAGGLVAGLASSRLELALGRARLLWSSALLLAVGTVGLTVGTVVAETVGSTLVMGGHGSRWDGGTVSCTERRCMVLYTAKPMPNRSPTQRPSRKERTANSLSAGE